MSDNKPVRSISLNSGLNIILKNKQSMVNNRKSESSSDFKYLETKLINSISLENLINEKQENSILSENTE